MALNNTLCRSAVKKLLTHHDYEDGCLDVLMSSVICCWRWWRILLW